MDPIDQALDFIAAAGRTGHSNSEGLDRPLVTLSYAQSLDGSLTYRRGAPLALSGPESLELTHRLRSAHQAILVGIGTVIADNPRLSVRLVDGKDPQPVILDSRLRIPLKSRLLQPEDGPRPKPVWIASTDQADPQKAAALEAAGVHLIQLPPDEHGRVPLAALLAKLFSSGVENLMVEGGARIVQAFLSARLVDQAVITLCPLFVGGLKAVDHPLAGIPLASASAPNLSAQNFPHFGSMEVAKLGDDLIVWGELRYPTR